MTDDHHPSTPRLGERLPGPDPVYRWSPLDAVAWIAARDLRWVKGMIYRVWGEPLSYRGDAPPVAEQAARSLEQDLHMRPGVLTYGESVSQLIDALASKPIAAFIGRAAVPLRNLQVIGLKFTGRDIGFDVFGDDSDRFSSVRLDAQQLMREFPAARPVLVKSDRGPTNEEVRAETRRIARELEAEGFTIRKVRAADVEAKWRLPIKRPKVSNFTDEMEKAPGGRRKKL